MKIVKVVLRSKVRESIIIVFTVSCIVLLFVVPPIPQDPSYHYFADRREVWSIQNFLNVISNLPFLLLGILGLYGCFKKMNEISYTRISVFTLFAGVTGIGFGSGYYHLNPENATLIWDRIPMTIMFMSYFSIILSTHVSRRIGSVLLVPLLMLGIASVIIWYGGELKGAGDLRLYALVQFYPMVMIPLIVFVYPTSLIVKIEIICIIALYAIAKVFESEDALIYSLSGQGISGHTLKHLFAAAAIAVIARSVRRNSHTRMGK